MERGARLVHPGFGGVEYEAAKQFFEHFDLEFPSVPLLDPEFRKPLFLQIICEGLNRLGLRRIPDGFHGLTQTFDLYLTAINKDLAKADNLNYDEGDNLVYEALKGLTAWMVEADRPWIPRRDALDIVNQLLPRSDFNRSLYQGLVNSGVLTEHLERSPDGQHERYVYITYERFADHVAADMLVREHLDLKSPQKAFEGDGGLAFLGDKCSYMASRLIPSLCILIPEATAQELFRLAPGILENPVVKVIAGESFRESIIWRRVDAFDKSSIDLLNEMNYDSWAERDTIETLLTVATVPGHSLNAELLDRNLREMSMSERDSWWSLPVHELWATKGSVDRLVAWAFARSPEDQLEDETVHLAAITLAWMLTSSNRYLRDRATKALVCLLTSRVLATCKLLRRFADVEQSYDDLYVVERLYAVAYGVAMRSHDAEAVECLASTVYDLVFASGSPRAHILLRDYARGVIERSIALGTNRAFDEQLFRPPYCSEWPDIPTEKDIERIVADWDHPRPDRQSNWNPVISSMLPERGIADFATYVIGVRSSQTDWLSLPLEDEPWKSLDERIEQMVGKMDDTAKSIWNDLAAREAHLQTESFRRPMWTIEHLDALVASFAEDVNLESSQEDVPTQDDTVSNPVPREEDNPTFQDLLRTDSARNRILCDLRSAIHPDLQSELNEIVMARESGEREQEPRFDLTMIQRYIIGRVREMGWTDDRFGCFDRRLSRSLGRDSAKVERIGKKYQWIAYHEILAYISDHYQYRERYFQSGGNRRYRGPWQGSFRDIDPSCMVVSTEGDSSSAWWHFDLQTDWGDGVEDREWIRQQDDLPDVKEILIATRSGESVKWVNVDCSFMWAQPTPVDYDTYGLSRREIWFLCMPYLVRSEDVDALVDWSESVDFFGRWMPEKSGLFGMFLGEHGWSDAYRYCEHQFEKWSTPEHGCATEIRVFGTDYVVETGFDCSIDDSYRLKMPHYQFIASMGLKWSGTDADYEDSGGDVVAFDPSACKGGPSALLIRDDVLRDYLSKEDLELCWVVLGEKQIIGGDMTAGFQGALRISGFYRFTDGVPEGSLQFSVEEPQS